MKKLKTLVDGAVVILMIVVAFNIFEFVRNVSAITAASLGISIMCLTATMIHNYLVSINKQKSIINRIMMAVVSITFAVYVIQFYIR